MNGARRRKVKIRRAKVAKLKKQLPRYCTEEESRHGKSCIYFRRRKGEPKIRLRAPVGSAEFHRDYALALEGRYAEITGTKIGGKKPVPASPPRSITGSWRWLCEGYFQSVAFKKLKKRTQAVRRTILEATWAQPISRTTPELTFGGMPMTSFTTRTVMILQERKVSFQTIIDEEGHERTIMRNGEAANSVVKAIRQVLKWAVVVHTELVGGRNCARDVTLYKSVNPGGHHTWTVEEIEQFESHFPLGHKARTALGLLLYGGFRRGDVVRIGPRHRQVREGRAMLILEQEKNAETNPVKSYTPIVPALQAILDAAGLKGWFYIEKNHGGAYTKESFGNLFRRWCRKAGLPHCSAHGLRKACVVRMIKDDCTPFEIMAVTGHRTMKEVERYGREFMRARAAEQAFERWLRKHQAEAADAEARLGATV